MSFQNHKLFHAKQKPFHEDIYISVAVAEPSRRQSPMASPRAPGHPPGSVPSVHMLSSAPAWPQRHAPGVPGGFRQYCKVRNGVKDTHSATLRNSKSPGGDLLLGGFLLKQGGQMAFQPHCDISGEGEITIPFCGSKLVCVQSQD
jgi:hypothetical protein